MNFKNLHFTFFLSFKHILILKLQFIFRYNEAKKVGFLDMYRENFWKKIVFVEPWEQMFLVLSNVGLLVFEEPGDRRSKYFIPIAGA